MSQPATTSTRHRLARRPSTGALVLAAFSALMIALAAGALWLLLSLRFSGVLITVWLALPMGLALGFIIRRWVAAPLLPAVAMAALATLLAAFYMRLLLTITELAGSFNLGFIETMHRAGAPMIAHLSWLSLSHMAIVIYLAAAALAAAMTWRTAPG